MDYVLSCHVDHASISDLLNTLKTDHNLPFLDIVCRVICHLPRLLGVNKWRQINSPFNFCLIFVSGLVCILQANTR